MWVQRQWGAHLWLLHQSQIQGNLVSSSSNSVSHAHQSFFAPGGYRVGVQDPECECSHRWNWFHHQECLRTSLPIPRWHVQCHTVSLLNHKYCFIPNLQGLIPRWRRSTSSVCWTSQVSLSRRIQLFYRSMNAHLHQHCPPQGLRSLNSIHLNRSASTLSTKSCNNSSTTPCESPCDYLCQFDPYKPCISKASWSQMDSCSPICPSQVCSGAGGIHEGRHCLGKISQIYFVNY